MARIAITGANGFIGKNLTTHLSCRDEHQILVVDRNDSPSALSEKLRGVNVVFHLAGVNRPTDNTEFVEGNTEYTAKLLNGVLAQTAPPAIVFASSIQAEGETPYGKSKRAAEELLLAHRQRGHAVAIFRLPNVFGKWCRPRYNSVVATYCDNLAQGVPLRIDAPDAELTLVHIDDLVRCFLACSEALPGLAANSPFMEVKPTFKVTLASLAEELTRLSEGLNDVVIPDLSNPLTKRLQSTLLSYRKTDQVQRSLKIHSDARGNLFELLRSESAGQVFVSRTKPGITRGNHYHHLKHERFCVISGKGRIELRKLGTEQVHEILVSGETPQTVAIIPGYTHSITNVGSDDMVTLFWANEPFQPEEPDTYFEEVKCAH